MGQTSRSLKYVAISSAEFVELLVFFIKYALASRMLGAYLGRLTKLWGGRMAMIAFVSPFPGNIFHDDFCILCNIASPVPSPAFP